MKTLTVKKIIYWAMALMPLLATSLCFPAFPEVIPGHYNLSGEVDRWGSRAELFLMPGVALLMAVIWWIFFEKMCQYSAKHGEPSNRKVLEVCKFAASILFESMAYVSLVSAYRQASGLMRPLDILRVLAVLLCIGDLVIANVLPKCRRNSWLGIRLPWTVEDDVLWHRTHRFGGKLMMAAGLVTLLLCLVIPNGFACIVTYVLGTAVVTLSIILYSYQLSLHNKRGAE